MSLHSEQVKNHPINLTLSNLFTTLDGKIDSLENPEVAEKIYKISLVAELVKSRISLSEPELLVINTLTNFNSWLQSTLNELNAYVGNKNIGHLTNAVNSMDNCLIKVQK